MVNHAMKNETVEIMVAPYLAGTVNHATMDETVKITDYLISHERFAWITDSATTMDREERLRRRERYRARETIEESRTHESRGRIRQEVRCLTP